MEAVQFTEFGVYHCVKTPDDETTVCGRNPRKAIRMWLEWDETVHDRCQRCVAGLARE